MKWTLRIFAIIGLVFLLVGGYLACQTLLFRMGSVRTTGEVVDLVGYEHYKPVVVFETADGQEILFHGSIGSSPPAYVIGERVQVYYQPAEPDGARIGSFSEGWLFAVALLGFGGVFFLVGVVPMWLMRSGEARLQRLRQSGQKLSVRLTRVERNQSISVNGRHPYRLVSEWQNPQDKKLYVYFSKNLWVDPDPFIPDDRMLDVYVDINNYKKYAMDTSFIPERA